MVRQRVGDREKTQARVEEGKGWKKRVGERSWDEEMQFI